MKTSGRRSGIILIFLYPTDTRPMHRPLLLLSALLLCSCQQQVETYTLQEARDFLTLADNTMSRGIDYLGSDEEYHYFEVKREFALDPRFRISRDATLYTPAETRPYHRWFPDRTAACKELKGLRLSIHDEPGGFIYQLEGKDYTSPADIPASQWQHVRHVYLGHKSLTVSSSMRESIAPYLQGRTDIRYSRPISGIPASQLLETPRSGNGVLTTKALDALMQNKN